MRVAFIGSEAFASVVLALHTDGHEITHIYTPGATSLPVRVRWDAVERACGLNVRRQLVGRAELELLHQSAAEVILCAGYPRRLPVRVGDPLPAVNIHPSPLPEGRGPRPFEWAILTGRETTAVTAHEMVERFDAGPILLQRAFPLGPRETTSSLEMRCTSISAELAVDLMRDFSALWDGRTPQAAGTFCRTPRRVDRTLNLMGSVDQIDRVLRAFSPGGVFVPIEGRTWVVFDAACWQERHSDVPGTVVALAPTGRLLAAADGYLLLRSALPEKLARLRFAAAKVKRFIR